MLGTKYKTAYRKIKPDNGYLDRIVDAYEDKKSHKRFFYVVKPALAAILILLFVGMLDTPVLVGKVPAVYRLLDKYAPQLLSYIMPEELSHSKCGIRMQLEAINIEGDEAKLLLVSLMKRTMITFMGQLICMTAILSIAILLQVSLATSPF